MKQLSYCLKHFLFIQAVFLLLAISCTPRHNSGGYSASVEEKISLTEKSLLSWVDTGDTIGWSLQERMSHYKINGLTIGVVNNFETEWVKCYGLADISEKRAVDYRTLFQAASVSKSINAAAILKLASRGIIDTSADINSLLKNWKLDYVKGPEGKQINLISLLSHTSGLSLFGYQGYPRGSKIPDLTAILNGSVNTTSPPPQQIFLPGERFFYSSAGVMISQKVIMDVTGKQYNKIIKNEVLRPLGMTNSFYFQPPPSTFSHRLASGYDRVGEEIPGKYFIYPELAAVGLWTTASDLCSYVAETCRAYNGITEKVLNKELTRRRLRPVKGESGLGFFITRKGNSDWFWHNGGSKGFTCIITGNATTGQGAVIMLNSENGEIMDEILASVATVYGWEGYLNRPRMDVLKRSVEELAKYCGEYDSGSELVKINIANGLPFLTRDDIARELFFTDDSTAFIKEQQLRLRFSAKGGKIKAMLVNGSAWRKIN